MFQPYTILNDKHIGETCFILGSGTSLNKIIKSSNFVGINDNVVISVNSSIIALSWDSGKPDKRYWTSNDASVMNWDYWNKVKNSKATKIIKTTWKEFYDKIPKDFLIFHPRKSGEYEVDFEDDGLCYISSMPTAIDLAIKMGCKNIFLLGCDHYFVQGKSYFWQFWPEDKRPIDNNKGKASLGFQNYMFEKNLMLYSNLNKFAEYRNSKIYDCSMNGRIKVFEKIDFEDLWQ